MFSGNISVTPAQAGAQMGRWGWMLAYAGTTL